MKTMRILTACVAGSLLSMSYAASALAELDAQTALRQASKTKIPFIQNQGQVKHKEVNFYARLFSGTLFVTKDNTLVYSVTGKSQQQNGSPNLSRWSFRESFINAKPLQPAGVAPSKIQVSHFKGTDTKNWQQHLPVFDRVSMGEVYDGIRVELQATGNNVEKLFYVAPGANPAHIKVALDGIQGARIDTNGKLLLNTALGEIAFTAPIAWQEIQGKRQNVKVKYALAGSTYGFKLGTYDPAHEIVIDPLLASTFLGGVNANPAQYSNYDQDIGYSIVVNGDNVYVGGVTQSTDFPIVMGYDDTANDTGRPDGFIARFNSDLSILYSSTFFGTDNFDRVSAIAMDSDGTIVATGQAGYGFPVTPGAYNYQGSEPVGGGFVAKFNADLSMLIASAVVTPSDYPTVLTVGNGSIYFGGRTNVPSFPITEGAYLSTCCRVISSYGQRDFDGFAGKISSDLSTLEAMTYLGGDAVTSIAVAPDSSLYITDGFGSAITGYLARMDADLTSQYAKVTEYPGTTSGSSRHYFYDVAVGNDYVVAVGQTYLNDLPVTAGAFDTSCGSDGDCDNSSADLYIPKPDGFIARYSLDLQTIQAMTYFGGSNGDHLGSVKIDSQGNIVVAGGTSSSDMPTSGNAFDNSCNGSCSDVFVAKLNNGLSQLMYGSYLGGADGDTEYDIAIAADDTVYVTGYTMSADFPTTSGAFDRTYAGGAGGPDAQYDTDAFVSHFDMSGDGGSGGGGGGGGTEPNANPVADAGSDQTVGPQQTVYLDGRNSSDSDGSIAKYTWTQESGRKVTLSNADYPIASFESPRVRRGKTKVLVFQLMVTDDKGATSTDQVTITVSQ